jgi:2-keto-4-pentenoate hydratase/2-oxohepta-3-ene-1,7-dioic acid hydratase in catechol pathway
MSAMVVPAPEPITIRVVGERARFTVRRIYLAGRNDVAHAREMNEGTPEGVGAVVPGDLLEAEIEGLDKPTITIGPPRE